MDAGLRTAIRTLLETERVLTAAVLVDGEPVAALLPYATSADLTSLYVQASSLARHSRGLLPGATISVLVHAADTSDRDPLQLPRLTVQATVAPIDRESPAFAVAADRLTRRFPMAATTLALGDFTVYALTLGRGRYVEGFARAFNVGAETFHALRS